MYDTSIIIMLGSGLLGMLILVGILGAVVLNVVRRVDELESSTTQHSDEKRVK